MNGSIWQKLMDHADLPAEPVPGLPVAELCGDRQILIEHHCGIREYGPCRIRVRVTYGDLVIEGCGMVLSRISRDQLVIRGRINTLQLCRRSSQ